MSGDESFGRLLRRLRKARDLSQEALAQQVYCAADTIKKLEQGLRRPSRQIAERLAECLAIPADQRAAFIKAARAELAVDRLPRPPELPAHSAISGTSTAPDHAGASVAESEPPPLIAGVLPTGTVTFLYTDIEGSTRLWEQHPEAMPEALAQHDSILRQAINEHEGIVFRTVGDGFCAAFARAPAALKAALAAQRSLHTRVWGPTGPLRVRMALHTGAVERGGDDYLGLPLSRVARLLAAGHGGQILLSLAMAELVREQLPLGVALRDLGERRLKDLTRSEHVFQVVAPGLPAEFPPLRTVDARSNNLPAQPNTLIGREREVSVVRDLLRRADVRLVTLTGPGGTGKTRLALQVASELLDEFTHGVWFVDLASIRDPALVSATIAATLGITEVGGQHLLDGLTAYLRDKRLLLVLDNFEQVVGAASIVDNLVRAAPHLKLLVTSRVVLGIYGEHDLQIPPLTVPDLKHLPPWEQLAQVEAVRLFAERAQAADHDFNISEANAATVAEICCALDGLPLAIELAASRVRLLPPLALLQRLSHRLQILTVGPRTLPVRQQTLRNTIAWSFDLLAPEEQILFQRLGVFVGGWTLEAAEAICDPDGQLPIGVLDGLQSLVDQSLVQQAEGPEGEPRLAMLETIREYALERLAATEQVQRMRNQHLAFFREFAEQAAAQFWGAKAEGWLARMAAEYSNLRAALEWARERNPDAGLHLVGAMWWFWNVYGYLSEGRQRAETLLAASANGVTPARAMALAAAASLTWWQGDYTRARALCEEGMQVSAAVGHQSAEAFARVVLGYLEADIERRATLWAEAQALFRAAGHRWGIAYGWLLSGFVAQAKHNATQAATNFREGLAAFQALGNKWGIGWMLQVLGDMASSQGQYAQARTYFQQALVVRRDQGYKGGVVRSLNALGHVALMLGDDEEARAAYEESLALGRELGARADIFRSLTGLGEVACQRGDLQRAETSFHEALELYDRLRSEEPAVARCLWGVGQLAAATGKAERATRLWGAAEALSERLGTPLVQGAEVPDKYRLGTPHHKDTYSAAWTEGQAMTLEQAVAYALEDENLSSLPFYVRKLTKSL